MGTRSTGMLGVVEGYASEKVFTPHTPLLHWFIIGGYIADENDYWIIESIPSHGVSIGRLSMYDWKDYRVFRLSSDDGTASRRMVDRASIYGRQYYSYLGILRMFQGVISIEWRYFKQSRRFRAIYPREMLPYEERHGVLCTRFIKEIAESAGVQILPDGDAALPATFIEALEVGIIREVTQC